MAQIAEGGGVTFPAREEMFVDAQELGAVGRMPFSKLALQTAPEVALDGGGADAFPATQPAAVHAVEVLLIDVLLEGFASSLARQDAGMLSLSYFLSLSDPRCAVRRTAPFPESEFEKTIRRPTSKLPESVADFPQST